MDRIKELLDGFLSLPDSSPPSSELSFDRLFNSRSSDTDQSLIDRALRFSSAVLEAAKLSSRKRAFPSGSHHQAATCSMLHKFAMDPICFPQIDLPIVAPKVTRREQQLSTLLQRLGVMQMRLQRCKLQLYQLLDTIRSNHDELMSKQAQFFLRNDKASPSSSDVSCAL